MEISVVSTEEGTVSSHVFSGTVGVEVFELLFLSLFQAKRAPKAPTIKSNIPPIILNMVPILPDHSEVFSPFSIGVAAGGVPARKRSFSRMIALMSSERFVSIAINSL